MQVVDSNNRRSRQKGALFKHYTNVVVAPVWIFLAGLVTIAVLADLVRRGTEQVAEHAGGAIGSLLNVSFGNAATLVLALFVLTKAQTQVVQAQVTGSITGTKLLFLGISLPAIFDMTERILSPHANRRDLDERLSFGGLGGAVVAL
jgi:calcium/proton exchanger cax